MVVEDEGAGEAAGLEPGHLRTRAGTHGLNQDGIGAAWLLDNSLNVGIF